MTPATWLGIGETPPGEMNGEINIEESPLQPHEFEALQDDSTDDDDDLDGLDDADGDDILGVDGSNGSAPLADIGEVEAEETDSSNPVIEIEEPGPELGEPEDEAEISGQMAGDEPEE